MSLLQRIKKRILRPFGVELKPTVSRWTVWPNILLQSDESEFEEIYAKIDPNATMVGTDRIVNHKKSRTFMLKEVLLSMSPLKHDMAECGVFGGKTVFVLSHYLKQQGFGGQQKFHLFDSWEGLPDPDPAKDSEATEKGLYSATEASVRKLMAPYDFAEFHKGWIPDTLEAVKDRQFSYLHLDLNLYQPTVDSLRFFWPRMSVPSVIMLDDYGFPGSHGVKAAVQEFAKEMGIHPIYLPTGQALIIKNA